MERPIGEKASGRISKTILGLFMSLVIFVGSPGGAVLAQTIVEELCGDIVAAGPGAYLKADGLTAYATYPACIVVTVGGAAIPGYCVDLDLDYP